MHGYSREKLHVVGVKELKNFDYLPWKEVGWLKVLENRRHDYFLIIK